ncbi:MAG TPA: F0F1 ATP synthase subunit B [Gemmataceae bacterium]|jgi:F-type H+-transporting ATPase subunit b
MQRGLLIVAIGLFALVLCSPASIGAEDHPAKNGAKQKGDHKKGDEVEQDLFTKAVDLGIWTLLVFLLLLFVLSKFAWKPMMQGLEQRERAIHSALHEAQQAREETARLRAQLEEQLRNANEQARTLLDEARRAGERTTAEMIAEAHKKIQAEQERLQREMNLAYSQARRDLQTQAAQLATLVASKVIRRQMNHDDHRQLVEEALAELRNTSDGRQEIARV